MPTMAIRIAGMRHRWRPFTVAAAVAMGCAGAPWPAAAARAGSAPPVAGVVTRVIDGDTLVFQPAGKPPLEVRLRDIDAPESCQHWGTEARKALEEMALGKQGMLSANGHDTYGRTLGLLTIDEQSLSKRLVEEGHAWSARYKWDNGPLVKQERQAKALSRGLHSQAGALPPSEFRRLHGACPLPGAATAAAPATTAGAAVTTGAAAGRIVAPAALPATPSRAVAPATFRCDGRTRCHQLGSCAEARYFLAHCPGVKIDGDGDGIPCEDHLCAAER
jgi:endonuclease YncB( thermonuclease family)